VSFTHQQRIGLLLLQPDVRYWRSVGRSMSQTSFLSASLSAELLTKLTRLSDIGEHVRDISRKIADLRDDPLPTQLDNSVPDYVIVLNAHTTMLRRRHWVFVVAGNSL